MTSSGEARWPTPLLTMKGRTKIWTWHVRTLYEAGKTTHVANVIRQYNIAMLAICEIRWNGAGQATLAAGEQLVYCGHEDEQHANVDISTYQSPITRRRATQWKRF